MWSYSTNSTTPSLSILNTCISTHKQKPTVLCCRQLSDNSAQLQTMLDVVIQYEQHGNAMLTHMLGNSYSAQDLLAYALAALAIASLGLNNSTKGARLPLMVLFAIAVLKGRSCIAVITFCLLTPLIRWVAADCAVCLMFLLSLRWCMCFEC